MTLRFAAPEDVSALLSIYERYISTPITFEYTLPSLEEFARRVASVQTFYPYLVAEENGELLGYAYAHRVAERPTAGARSYPSTSVRTPSAVGWANSCTSR